MLNLYREQLLDRLDTRDKREAIQRLISASARTPLQFGLNRSYGSIIKLSIIKLLFFSQVIRAKTSVVLFTAYGAG